MNPSSILEIASVKLDSESILRIHTQNPISPTSDFDAIDVYKPIFCLSNPSTINIDSESSKPTWK